MLLAVLAVVAPKENELALVAVDAPKSPLLVLVLVGPAPNDVCPKENPVDVSELLTGCPNPLTWPNTGFPNPVPAAEPNPDEVNAVGCAGAVVTGAAVEAGAAGG